MFDFIRNIKDEYQFIQFIEDSLKEHVVVRNTEYDKIEFFLNSNYIFIRSDLTNTYLSLNKEKPSF